VPKRFTKAIELPASCWAIGEDFFWKTKSSWTYTSVQSAERLISLWMGSETLIGGAEDRIDDERRNHPAMFGTKNKRGEPGEARRKLIASGVR